MPTNLTSEPPASPVPGVVGVREDAVPPPPRRNPARKLLSALRGDKYMVDAYPPGEER